MVVVRDVQNIQFASVASSPLAPCRPFYSNIRLLIITFAFFCLLPPCLGVAIVKLIVTVTIWLAGFPLRGLHLFAPRLYPYFCSPDYTPRRRPTNRRISPLNVTPTWASNQKNINRHFSSATAALLRFYRLDSVSVFIQPVYAKILACTFTLPLYTP